MITVCFILGTLAPDCHRVTLERARVAIESCAAKRDATVCEVLTDPRGRVLIERK